MSSKSIKNHNISLTPSTAKLNQLRVGKGLGMLTAEEIELLRKSKKEIADACREAREIVRVKDAASSFVGIHANNE